jgi:hypothetical protein
MTSEWWNGGTFASKQQKESMDAALKRQEA